MKFNPLCPHCEHPIRMLTKSPRTRTILWFCDSKYCRNNALRYSLIIQPDNRIPMVFCLILGVMSSLNFKSSGKDGSFTPLCPVDEHPLCVTAKSGKTLLWKCNSKFCQNNALHYSLYLQPNCHSAIVFGLELGMMLPLSYAEGKSNKR